MVADESATVADIPILSYLLLDDISLLGCSSRKDGGLESSSGSSLRDRTTTGKNNNYSSKEPRDLT
jgi:hypothetical protein